MASLQVTVPRTAEASDGRVTIVAPAGTERVRLALDGEGASLRVIARRDIGGRAAFDLQTTAVDREGGELAVEALGANGVVLARASVPDVHLLGPGSFVRGSAPRPAALGSARASQIASSVASPVGISVACVGSGLSAGANQGTPTRAASTLKVAIVLAALTRQSGEVTTSAAFPAYSSAIVASDNGSANQVLAQVGDGDQRVGARAVNALMSRLGMRDTYLDGPYVETAVRSRKTTSAADLRILASALLTTASDGSGVLGDLGVSRHEARVLLGLMSSTTYPGIIRAHTPGPVAHKSGWLDDQQNDLALVFGLKGGPCAVGMVTEGLSFGAADALGKQVVQRVIPALVATARRPDAAAETTSAPGLVTTPTAVTPADPPTADPSDGRSWAWIGAIAIALVLTGLLVARRTQVRRRRRRRDVRRASRR